MLNPISHLRPLFNPYLSLKDMTNYFFVFIQKFNFPRPRYTDFFHICTAAVTSVGALLNVLVFIVILVDPLKILRKGSWITIINLLAADLVVCIIMFYFRIQVHFVIKELNYYFVMSLLFSFAVSASFMLLAFFSLQLYTITKFPFKARHFWTHNRVVLCCVGIWLLAALLGLDGIFIFFYRDFDKFKKWWTVRFVVLSIIVIIQIVLKILTCWEIFKTRRNSGQSQSSKHRQITTTVMIMVVIQMFTAVPYVVMHQLWHEVFSLNFPLLLEIMTYYSPLAGLNFCVNPIIYFLCLPDYRSSLLSLCGFRKRKNQTFSNLRRNEKRELLLLHVPPAKPQLPS